MQIINVFFQIREIDRSEDERDRLEKDSSSLRSQLNEAAEERRRLGEENERLKQLLKRETERLDGELAARANVIREYKEVAARLQQKLDRKSSSAAAGAKEDPDQGQESSSAAASDRVRELELELAQTKLALVETECKNQVRFFLYGCLSYSFALFPTALSNQDLAHQFSHQQQLQQAATSSGSKTWLSKTLSSIKVLEVARSSCKICENGLLDFFSSVQETATAHGVTAHMVPARQGSSSSIASTTTSDTMKKSTSVDAGFDTQK